MRWWVLAVIIVSLITYSLCVVAGKADEEMGIK